MTNPAQYKIWSFRIGPQMVATPLVLAIAFLLTVVAAQPAQAQTFHVLHNFTGGQDGSFPLNGLTIDRTGSLYGTALNGGVGFGTVYKLTERNGSWAFSTLYKFTGGSDGAGPDARVTIDVNGILYGSTVAGGQGSCNEFGYSGCGTVFNLRPRPSECPTSSCPWKKSVLYTFSGGNDGGTPVDDLTFDQSGSLYGGTLEAGCNGYGVVYELTPSEGSWTEATLYCANAARAGGDVHGGITFDRAGNIYGVLTLGGQNGGGAVYELTPPGNWNETTLTDFPNPPWDGNEPVGGLIIDSAGNLYGTAASGGPANGGTIFELSPSGGAWTYNVLYGLSGCESACGSSGKLVMDAAGNLYGTTNNDGQYGNGSVFELTPSDSGWIYTDLHDFTGGSDGGNPRYGGVVLDSSGNLYGTASIGGTGGGVVWEITP